MATRRKQSPLIWIIEAFSVFTAAGFVLSGVGNGLAFWIAWKLNYFMIATPSDVVMSGFLVVGIALSVTAAVFAVAALFVWSARAAAARRVVHVEEVGPDKSDVTKLAEWLSRHLWRLALISLLAAVAGTQSLVFQQVPATLRQQQKDASAFEKWGRDDQQFSYSTGLKLAPASRNDLDCVGSPILWMGSSSAIVGCQRGVRVFHKLDDIVTEPLGVKRDPKEYAPAPTSPPIKVVVEIPKAVEPTKSPSNP